MISNEKESTLGIPLSQYNMITGEELECSDLKKCAVAFLESWGAKLTTTRRVISRTSIIVSNGKRYRLFQYHARLLSTTESFYDWETLVSNVFALWILVRWALEMATFHREYLLGVSEW